jgi:phthalate 4,5-cis-dihydrodiol dehydrogenase
VTAIRVGIAGMGAAGLAFVPALKASAGFEWVALAEPQPDLRQNCVRQYGLPAYATLDEMLAHPALDAVLIATPTALHAINARQVAQAGKHVLVEKPMAVSLDEATSMIAAAEHHGVALVVGHSHSHDAPIREMRAVIDSGELGQVRMVHTWCYTDWMQRPRRSDELDVAQGGGVTYRQGAHQFDILRLLCGGLARRVRARTFDWDPQRHSVGAHTVWIDFANGAVATAVYNGYGGFSSMDLCHDISEWGLHLPPSARQAPQALPANASPDEILRAKQRRAGTAIARHAPHQPFFGLTLVSCERGDIRQSPQGLNIYSQDGMREMVLPRERSPRDLVLEEWRGAISGVASPVHDGRWGMANLEICIAAHTSSSLGTEIDLAHQCAPGDARPVCTP